MFIPPPVQMNTRIQPFELRSHGIRFGHSPDAPEEAPSDDFTVQPDPPADETPQEKPATFLSRFSSCFDILLVPFKLIGDILKGLLSFFKNIGEVVPSKTYLENLQSIEKSSPAFAKQVEALKTEPSLPTFEDQNLLLKISEFISQKDLHSRLMPGVFETPERQQDKDSLNALQSGDAPQKLEAAEYFLHQFMQTGLPQQYPEYFGIKPEAEPQATEEAESEAPTPPEDEFEPDTQKVVAFAQTPAGIQYKGIEVPTPETHFAALESIAETFKDEESQAQLSQALPPRLRENMQMALPLVALAVFDGQLQLEKNKAFPDAIIQDNTDRKALNAAFKQIKSDKPAEWLKGLSYFGNQVDQDFKSYVRRLVFGEF